MTPAEEFEALWPLLFSIAYRIPGSVSEVEDAVQDTSRPSSARAAWWNRHANRAVVRP